MQALCKMKENVNTVLTSIRHPILKDLNQMAEKLKWGIRWDCYCQDTIMQRNCLRSGFCAFWGMSHPANSVYRLTCVDNVAVYWLKGFLGTKALKMRAALCWNPVQNLTVPGTGTAAVYLSLPMWNKNQVPFEQVRRGLVKMHISCAVWE